MHKVNIKILLGSVFLSQGLNAGSQKALDFAAAVAIKITKSTTVGKYLAPRGRANLRKDLFNSSSIVPKSTLGILEEELPFVTSDLLDARWTLRIEMARLETSMKKFKTEYRRLSRLQDKVDQIANIVNK